MHLSQQEPGGGSATNDLRTLLSKDHGRLDELFEQLIAAFRAGDRDQAAALWDAFDTGLEAHMALEESRLLPEFAKVDPEEAAALTREHTAIRNALSQLGIGVDLHYTNAAAVERFIQVLREHAKREDSLMYRWAHANLREEVQTPIRAQLLAALRQLVGATR